ncbi:hypothetical protein RND71_039690 [Anisodus tanguticus]|uniref:Uncharacterized protein n=1 Tax=Anisodus tanguticus TaxID=243964 RepID=A0AAE1QWA7_9SOLA|nr:hypothetical protein RND71_039690 [Anisodus tanguticus]
MLASFLVLTKGDSGKKTNQKNTKFSARVFIPFDVSLGNEQQRAKEKEVGHTNVNNSGPLKDGNDQNASDKKRGVHCDDTAYTECEQDIMMNSSSEDFASLRSNDEIIRVTRDQ